MTGAGAIWLRRDRGFINLILKKQRDGIDVSMAKRVVPAMPGMQHGANGSSKSTPMPMASPATGGKTLYTCVMHPEVVQDHPGNCPKCGMKLVEKK